MKLVCIALLLVVVGFAARAAYVAIHGFSQAVVAHHKAVA